MGTIPFVGYATSWRMAVIASFNLTDFVLKGDMERLLRFQTLTTRGTQLRPAECRFNG